MTALWQKVGWNERSTSAPFHPQRTSSSVIARGKVSTNASRKSSSKIRTSIAQAKRRDTLPPLAEQRRIVAKVDELMALCDELETRQQARCETRTRLQHSALNHMLSAREPRAFAAHWHSVRDHFHLLHETPDSVPQLRQTLLELTLQGRLTVEEDRFRTAKRANDLDEAALSARWEVVRLADVAEHRLAELSQPEQGL